MKALLRYLVIGTVGVVVVGCGSKGDAEPEGMDGSGGSSSGGSGGTGGSGGSGGTGGMAQIGELVFGFDEDDQGWKFVDSNSDMGAGIEPVPTGDISIEWADGDGNPGGALRCEIAYSDVSQWVSFGIDMTAMPQDLSGLIITADVQILEGVGEADDLLSAPAGAKIYAKSGGSYVYANGSYNNIDEKGVWKTILFDLSSPDFVDEANGVFDPAEIREIGVQFDTSSTTKTAQPGVWLIDNIRY